VRYCSSRCQRDDLERHRVLCAYFKEVNRFKNKLGKDCLVLISMAIQCIVLDLPDFEEL
jgi:hypothetical protein